MTTALQTAYARLSDRQREAIENETNTLVLAGPGSGKTDTIVLKAAHLLRDVLPATRGLATLTFNNDTAREIAERLARVGHQRSRRLSSGTIHSFALNHVLRTFGPFVTPRMDTLVLVTQGNEQRLWLQVFSTHGLNEDPHWSLERRIRIRRALALGDDASTEDDRLVAACRDFDDLLVSSGWIDFEGMILKSYTTLRENPEFARSIVGRYPWLLIDEYQDLGEILHAMTLLLSVAGARILAVGDPDQSIYGFSGAEPALMNQLVSEHGFVRIELEFNYRSGRAIIEAAQAALGHGREVRPDPTRTDPGEVTLANIEGGIEEQATYVAREVIPSLVRAGIQAEEIAILYSARGQVPTALQRAMTDAGVPFVAERDTVFPGGQIGRWLQRCARRGIDPESIDAEPLSNLLSDVQRWIPESRRLDGVAGLRCIWRLVRSAGLDGARLDEWVGAAERELQLLSGIAASVGAEDLEDYATLITTLDDPAFGGTKVAEYAEGARVVGKVVLTTYHSSKGRQFDAVVLPALQEQLMPRLRWDRFRHQMTISAAELAEQRRLFYVGFTRARAQVVLVSSEAARNDKGFLMARSRFVGEVSGRLAAVSS